MIQITEVAFTSYPVTDLARARAFYEQQLGLAYEKGSENEGRGFAEYKIGSGYFSILNGVPGWKPSGTGPAISFEVADFDRAVADLKEKGVPFVMEPFPTGVCRMAIISDPDGNQVIIHKLNS